MLSSTDDIQSSVKRFVEEQDMFLTKKQFKALVTFVWEWYEST